MNPILHLFQKTCFYIYRGFNLTLLLFLFCGSSFAQSGTPQNAGARGAALGNASVTFTDINSAFANQAGLAELESFTATVFAEQRFLLTELQALSAAAALPTASGTFGITLHHFGFEAFREQRFGFAYARPLLEGTSIGAQILVLNTNIPEYGSRSNLTFEIGFTTQLMPQLKFAGHLYSPMRVEIVEGEQLPTIFKLGTAYLPSDRVTLTAEVEKDIDFPARVKAGIEYQLVEQLHLRTGIATNPTNLAFGVGYKLQNGLSFDLASVYHQWLGFTPSIGIIFQRK